MLIRINREIIKQVTISNNHRLLIRINREIIKQVTKSNNKIKFNKQINIIS